MNTNTPFKALDEITESKIIVEAPEKSIIDYEDIGYDDDPQLKAILDLNFENLLADADSETFITDDEVEIADPLLSKDATHTLTLRDAQDEYGDDQVDELIADVKAKYDIKESKQKLTEGTSNFRSQDSFDMWAISDNDLAGFDNFTEDEKEAVEAGDYDYYNSCIEIAYDDLNDFVDEELNSKLEHFTIALKGGYYEGLQSYVFPNCNKNTGREFERDDIEDAIYDLESDFVYYEDMSEEEAHKKAEEIINAEVEKINKELLPRLKEHGMYQIKVAYRFSNGETGYTKVESLTEAKKEPADLSKVKGTYSKLLVDNSQKIWDAFEAGDSLDSLKVLVKKIISSAHDTPAKRSFILKVDKSRSPMDLTELVSNAILRADKDTRLVGDKWANESLKEDNEDYVYLTADFLETDDDFYIFINDIVSSEDDKNWEGVSEEEKQILLAAREFHKDFFEKCGNKEFKTYEEFLAALKAVYDDGDYPLLECKSVLKEEDKLETFDDKMDFLAKDEDEAIEGYEEVIPEVEDEHVKDQLEKIKTEEEAHKEYLEKVKEDPSIDYVEPLEPEEEKKEEEPLKETFEGDSIIDDLAERAQDMINDGGYGDVSDCISQAIDDGLIYSDDIIELAKHYGVLDDGELISSYYDDLFDDVYALVEEPSDDEEEPTDESLTESTSFKLNDAEEVKEAKEFLENSKEETPIEKIVDVTTEVKDELKDSYIGDTILQCTACKTLIYKSPDELVKSEQDENIYNVDEKCPHCGSLLGYNLVGQVASLDTKTEDEVEEESEDFAEIPEDNEPLPSEESEEEVSVEVKEEPKPEENKDENKPAVKEESLDLSKLDKKSLQYVINEYLNNVYENVKDYSIININNNEDKVIVEGLINFDDKKVKSNFEFTASTMKSGKVKLTGFNESLSTKKSAFKIRCSMVNDRLMCENLDYKYLNKLTEEVVKGTIKNK